MCSVSPPPNTTSKRHSMTPRPLQLVNGVASPTTTAAPGQWPITPDNHHYATPLSLTKNGLKTPVKRQSSISYKTSSYDDIGDSENNAPPIRTKPRPRSAIYPSTPPSASRDRGVLEPGSSVSATSVEERPPLTLAEKHADLLRFIAQKEYKCLELRSQLAIHETELLQLKRKWERTVSRGFESPLSSSFANSGSSLNLSPSPTTTNTTHTTTATTTTTCTPPVLGTPPTSPAGTVLEGIKEGVSRLFAAGLSISSDYPHPPSPNSQSRISSATKPLKPRPRLRPQSMYAQCATSSHVRSPTNHSISSASTNATSASKTSSTSSGPRTPAASLHSASSFSEDEVDDTRVVSPAAFVDVGDTSMSSMDSSELIVKDTGATPTVCPNPKFKFKAGRRRERQQQQEKEGMTKESEDSRMNFKDGGEAEHVPIPEVTPSSNMDMVTTGEPNGDKEVEEGLGSSSAVSRSNSRCHRRKSKDVSFLPSSLDDLADPSTLKPDPHSATSPRSGSCHSSSTYPADRPRTAPTSVPAMNSKPSSLVGMLAPVSTIPGLSLAESAFLLMNGAGAGDSGSGECPSAPTESEDPLSSWMGKTWGSFGFQSSTISKSQKRASLLLTDVSQTLANAFSLSGVVGGSATPASPFTPAGLTLNVDSLASSPSVPPADTSTPPSNLASILDQDDYFFSATVKEPMKPTLVNPSTNTGKVSSAPRKGGVKTEHEEDCEWNW